ncbi:MAG: flagellar motor switch protein FliN [Bryobacteraceae bacterium]|jgi:flagellar motor switch protein FliN/FliY
MNVGETAATGRPPAEEAARRLIDAWAEGLAQVFEFMAGVRPEVHWRPAEPFSPEGGAENDVLWWEQPFPLGAGAAAWVGAPRSTWEPAGVLTLKAAGLETVDPAEARNTWIEILGQSFSAMARAAGSFVSREIVLEAGAERPPSPGARDCVSVSVQFPGEAAASLSLALGAPLLDAISGLAGAPPEQPETRIAVEDRPVLAPVRSRTMDLLLEIELPVSISFGKKQLALRDVLKLTTGSIVELDRDVGEPVEILVNHCLIARGEVVVVEGNYGVRIQQIVSQQDRLRSFR